MRTTTPIRDGIRASIPPDLESFWCLAVMLDFFFFLIIRLLLEIVDDAVALLLLDSSLDQSFCLSLFLRRLLLIVVVVVVVVVVVDCLDLDGDEILFSSPIPPMPFPFDEAFFSSLSGLLYAS
jgi:hypothetical protein